jgi:acetyl esterase/lipase
MFSVPDTYRHHAFESADAFVPVTPTGTSRPAIMLIHGGGWSGGNRRQLLDHAKRLAERGYVTATVSYRLSAVAQWPAQLEDVRTRLRELVSHADDWRIDTARIGIVGSSAGGHLAACMGTRHKETPDLPSPACIVDIHGVHDCTRRLLAQSLKNLLGSPEEFAERWNDASPIRFVDGDSSPMLLTHDPSDATVPYEQTAMMIGALVQAGRPVQFIPTPGSGHGFFYNFSNPWTARIWPEVVNYLDQRLRET